MKCFGCAKGKMIPPIADMAATVRREQIPVRTEAMLCKMESGGKRHNGGDWVSLLSGR